MAVVAAVGLASGLAQTLFTALQTKEVREMCSLFGCEAQLMKLKDTMENINALLLDVDSKRQGLTNEGQVWVEKLKDAVYDIDDLLDEFATIGQQRKQMEDAGFRKMVGNFFSRNNKFFVNFNLSGEIKKLREKLDDIAKDHENYGLSIDVNKHFVRRPETSSTISDLEVIGREGDEETILHKLLSDSIPSDFNGRFVCIVGIGGLGKTTLAQLVYNHKKVQEAFSLRIWVCVSEEFGPKEILDKILKAQSKTESSNLEAAQRDVKTLLERKKYLLVLDDVWNESHEKWRDLMPYLVSDVSGSKIIVTSRSENVAKSIGGEKYLHKLQGLSKDNSWRLFKRIAFETESEDEVDPDLVAIGKDIVKKCVNVPLCIRVIASLLYDQPKKKWESCRSIDLSANMSDAEGNECSIMPTLRFSYYQLTPGLKSCFSFCSLFPKDHVMEKEFLIQLWMAEGYLVPNGQAQSLEDVGDQYFTILLNRCFFQDIKLDEHGDVYSFKMHDLMHDLTLNVAGKESLINSPCPHVKQVLLWGVNEALTFCMKGGALSSNVSTSLCVTLDNARVANTVVSGFVGGVVSIELELRFDHKMKSMEGFERLRQGLKGLSIHNCEELDMEDEEEEGMPWRYLESLSSLKLSALPKMVKLPKGLQYLTSLQSLHIQSCENLEELGDCIGSLTSLQYLRLERCKKLKALPECIGFLTSLKFLSINEILSLPESMRHLTSLTTLEMCYICKELWPKICHIPNLCISREYDEEFITEIRSSGVPFTEILDFA